MLMVLLLAVLGFALIGLSLVALLVGILIWQHYFPREARSTLEPIPELEGAFAEIPVSEVETGLEEQIPSDVVAHPEILLEGRNKDWGESVEPCSHVPRGRPCAICMGREKFKKNYGDWRDD